MDYPHFPNGYAEMYHVGDPHCLSAHAEIYFRAPRNTRRGSAQQSIEGHQKHKARRREEVVEVTESCFSISLRKKSGRLNKERFGMKLSHSYLKRWQQNR